MSDLERKDLDYQTFRASSDESISLLDLIAVIVKRKWMIIWVTGIVALVTLVLLVLSLVLPSSSRLNFFPNQYKATVKILVQDKTPGSSLSSILGQSSMSGLSGLLGVKNVDTSAGLAIALLNGNKLADAVSEDLGFAERFHFNKAPKSQGRRKLFGVLRYKYQDDSGILEITWQNQDPVFVTDVINDVADRLQSQFKELAMDKVLFKKQYLEESITRAEQDVADKSAQLLAFQNKYGIYDLPAQSQANITTVAALQTQLTQKLMDLELERKYLPESDVRITRLKDEIAQQQRLISDMKVGGKSGISSSVPLREMATLAVQYNNIQRDLDAKQSILGVLKQQYEMAKIEALDNSPTFQVVEKAEVPETRSGPGRTRTLIIATLATGILMVLVAFVVEYFSRARRNPGEAVKLEAIRSSLGLRKKLPRS